MTTIQNSDDLFAYIVSQSNSGQKNWFGFTQQRIAGIHLAYQMAIAHGNTMSPEEIADYVVGLNNAIFNKLVKGDK
jgi:hypothetical protein